MAQHGSNRGDFSIARDLFTPEHDLYRYSVRRFVETELVPHHDEWEKAGIVPREVWRQAGAVGLLCPSIPEEYGGVGGGTASAVPASWSIPTWPPLTSSPGGRRS